ncbi:MAG: flagellar hook-basal body complex protein FliE [Acidobacteria bacterium]|nr:flagellar hook-basal body complex protein FliE [Acidobacteriota bacterium]MBI3427000.1 flagellar hook-basal body complex protein FliE [Acidobacteriota bacterium]
MIEGISAAITSVTSTATGTAGQATGGALGTGDGSFGSFVRGAVERLDRGQHTVEEEMARAVAGESPDLHRTMVTLQAEDLSFQLALQVRNKVIGAYEEIMRMQV